METSTPFIETKVTKKVALEPFELSNEILYNLTNKLKILEKKCHKFGYLVRVNKVIEHSDGIIIPEDLMCKTTFSVTFTCIVCDPQEETVIIAKVKKLDQTMISSEVGPIVIVTPVNRLTKDFKVVDERLIHEPTKEEISKGSYVKVKVLAKRYFTDSTYIKVVGVIVGLSSDEEYTNVNSLINDLKHTTL